MRKVEMYGIEMQGSKMKKVDMSESKAARADFRKLKYEQVKMRKMDMKEVSMEKSEMIDCDFDGSDMSLLCADDSSFISNYIFISPICLLTYLNYFISHSFYYKAVL
jgi:uncharacterized protein YjbI with pentapeptide repeats